MPLKHRKRLFVAIKQHLHEQLKELSKNTKKPMSKLVDEAIEDLLEKYRKEKIQ